MITLKARALRWLAQREHSRAELRGKLLRVTETTEVGEAGEADDEGGAKVDAVLDWLVANRYLDEQRFIESRLRQRAPRFGTLRIAGELKQHGLALDADSAASLRANELQRARALWSRRFGDTPPSDAAARAKQARFLAGRGFSAATIGHVLRGVSDDSD